VKKWTMLIWKINAMDNFKITHCAVDPQIIYLYIYTIINRQAERQRYEQIRVTRVTYLCYSAQGPQLQLLHISSSVRNQPVVDPRFVTFGTCPLRIWVGKRWKKARSISFKRKVVLTTKRRQGNVHIIKQTKRPYCTPMISKTQNYS
jgi:hypothetical protein